MAEFLERLKRRKLVQWALAYLAGAWVFLQVLGLAAESYHWPDAVMRLAFARVDRTSAPNGRSLVGP